MGIIADICTFSCKPNDEKREIEFEFELVEPFRSLPKQEQLAGLYEYMALLRNELASYDNSRVPKTLTLLEGFGGNYCELSKGEYEIVIDLVRHVIRFIQ